jgi:hypothetical protein
MHSLSERHMRVLHQIETRREKTRCKEMHAWRKRNVHQLSIREIQRKKIIVAVQTWPRGQMCELYSNHAKGQAEESEVSSWREHEVHQLY